MKRFIVVAALAATAAVPAVASAGVPLGSDNACGAGDLMGQGASSCRFIDAGTIGVGGFTDTGWTLTHKEKVAQCSDGIVSALVTKTISDDGGSGQSYIGSQPSLTPGVTYTLAIQGNGFAFAGAPGSEAVAPTGAEPPDTAVDKTAGAQVGDAC